MQTTSELSSTLSTKSGTQVPASKNVLLGYRIKVESKSFPHEKYVADLGLVTIPKYAKISDLRSAKQRCADLEIANWRTNIEPVYGKLEV